jgi:assimilatory nitrate reductase catalytic subunit
MHPCDMRHRGLEADDLVRVSNPRGNIVVRVSEGAGLKRGRAWLPMHWGNRFMNSAGVNALTISACDPYSQQPELKHAAVAINKADLPWPLVVLRKCAAGDLEPLALLDKARALLPSFAYASVGLYGRAEPLVVFRAAMKVPLTDAQLQEIDALFGLAEETSAIVYADKQRQISKRAVTLDGKLLGVRLAGETLAQSWLKDVMADDTLDATLIRWAVAPIGKAPGKLPEKSRVVCKCADVTEQQIKAELAQGANFTTLQDKLKCGTFCGACVPELKQMAALPANIIIPA